MKLISWNVNGLRACRTKGFDEFLATSGADIVCLQETKLQPEQVDFAWEGWHVYWNSAVKKGYSGTALITREEPLSVRFGLGIPEHDGEGRVITAEYPAFTLVTVYTPNAQRELTRLAYREEWEDAFLAYVTALRETKPVVICGDLNVAHSEIDLKNPKPNMGCAGFTEQERGKLSRLLESGFTDTFRHFYPEQTGAYTWWSYMYHARENNAGWRIDYFLTSQELEAQLANAGILAHVLGSDHCPVTLELNVSGSA